MVHSGQRRRRGALSRQEVVQAFQRDLVLRLPRQVRTRGVALFRGVGLTPVAWVCCLM